MSGKEKRKLVGFIKLNKWFVTEDCHKDLTGCPNYIVQGTSILISLSSENLNLNLLVSHRILRVCAYCMWNSVWNFCTYVYSPYFPSSWYI